MATQRLGSLAIVLSAITTTACQDQPFDPPPKSLHLEVTGHDFEWQVRYPGRDGILSTDDDFLTRRNITLLIGVPTRIDLKSRDYIYSFALPHVGLKEIAVPDLTYTLEFTPREIGEYQLLGDQLCGYIHPKLIGRIHVRSPDAYVRWRDQEIQRQNRDSAGL